MAYAEDYEGDLDEATIKEMNRLESRSTPEKGLQRGKTLAHHLLDDQYLKKTTRINSREVDLAAYADGVADRWGFEWLSEFTKNKSRYRVSASKPRGEGRKEIARLGSPVILNRTPRRRSLWPFRPGG